jgi:uncharacterized BrkB/YihY/UPF0761 family membrane protein
MIFKILPNAITRWRDVWIGAVMTAVLFLIGKWTLGIYLGSGTAASVYGAASSLITLLLLGLLLLADPSLRCRVHTSLCEAPRRTHRTG